MSRRYYLPEISAAQAIELNAAIPGFDNKMSIVYQAARNTGKNTDPGAARSPFDDHTNWIESSALCLSPTQRSRH